MFYAKGYCMRGNSCWFNHKRPAPIPFVADGVADVMEEGSFEEVMKTSREPRYIMLRLVDYTVTVKTLDLEEYFFKAWISTGGEARRLYSYLLVGETTC